MSLSLADLRSDLRIHTGKGASLSDGEADQLLNRAWWPLAAQLKFSEKDAEFTFTTVSGTQEYSFPSDSDSVQRVVVYDSDSQEWVPLVKQDDWNMFAKQDNDEDAFPVYYSRRNDQFIFFPVPDDEYDVRVKYQQTLADLQTSGPGVPQEWHEVILWGAVARGFFRRWGLDSRQRSTSTTGDVHSIARHTRRARNYRPSNVGAKSAKAEIPVILDADSVFKIIELLILPFAWYIIKKLEAVVSTVQDLRTILIGVDGRNGIRSRVMRLERKVSNLALQQAARYSEVQLDETEEEDE